MLCEFVLIITCISLVTQAKTCSCGKAKKPCFGLSSDQKATCCSKCKTAEMVDVVHKKCSCGNRPSFGFPDKKAPTHCAKCKTPGMQDVVSKKCKCGKSVPIFGFSSDARASCCSSCKEPEMLDIAHNKCTCGKARPSFARAGQKASCCRKCKTEDMIDVENRKCKCGRVQPKFGFEGDISATRCETCKEPGMINLLRRVCSCGEHVPTFGFLGDPRPTCCFACKQPDMIDLHHNICLADGCDSSAQNAKFRGYCQRCFVYLFPDDQINRSYKIKEQHVADVISELLSRLATGLQVTYDKAINGGCSRRRPDVFIDCLTHCVLTECDEHCHRSYEEICENKRTMQLFTDTANRPLVIIRLNPDGYVKKDGSKVPSCFGRHQRLDVPLVKKKEWAIRTSVLEEHVMHHLHNVPEKEITVVRLFYDGYD